MSIFINPGAGNIEENLGFEQAYKNILQFIADCEVPLLVIESEHTPSDDGRYKFTLELEILGTVKFEVNMPPLSLEKVRYIGEENQNIWDYPRLYVDGSSWVWKYATIKKSHVIGIMQSNIADCKRDIEICEEVINELEN